LIQILKHFPPTPPFFPGSTSLLFLYLLPTSGTGGRGMGVTVILSHVVSAVPCPSGGRLLTFCPCSSVRSLSWETVLHVLLQRESFPRAAALHKLPQRGSLPWGAVLQEQAAPAWVPHGVTITASKPAPAWAPLSMGPQVLAGACSSTGLPTASARHPPAPVWGPSQAAGGHLLHRGPPWTAGGTACLTMVFIMSCKGKLSAPVSRAPPPPPSSLTLVSAELFLLHRLTPLYRLPFHCNYFSPS